MNKLQLNLNDEKYIINKYEESFKENGFSSESVLLTKEKQEIRFNKLISRFDLNNSSVLEFGCGFGDINKILNKRYKNYEYLGVDLVEEFIKTGRQVYGNENVKFECGDFLKKNFEKNYDYVIESGIFNIKLKDMDNLNFIEASIKKAFQICNVAIAFNFLTERVNFKGNDFYYINPERILEIAYKYSKRVILENDYMPFDYTIIIYKDDSYNEKAIFNKYGIC